MKTHVYSLAAKVRGDCREGKCQVKFGAGKGETIVDGQYISPEAIK